MSSRQLWTLALLLAGVLAWPGPTVHAQEQPRAIQGQVVNGTQDGGDVGGMAITLHESGAFSHEHRETIADEQGGFSFDEIVFDPAIAYGVSVTYQGALYGADLDLTAGSPPSVSLTVYEAAHASDVLSLPSASLLLAGADETARLMPVLEIVTIANGSDRTYVPDPELSRQLWFELPAGAQGLQLDTELLEAEILQDAEGFSLLASVPPGQHRVMFTYEFPYTGSRLAFAKPFPYGVEYLRLLAPYGIGELSSDRLGIPEPVVIEQRSYQLLEGTSLPRGALVPLSLTGIPELSVRTEVGRRLDAVRFEYAAPVALGLLMALLIGFALWRRSTEGRAGGSRAQEASGADGEGD